ncbi:DHH family phosphoesterase [Lutispora sp.]|uniref:DHH family phosphoesterase n=1 Tax=Lutispora sp. TaxID=2828727 RepID=UPI000EDE5E14|nr:bifunctional oligoribonuclease/PAP phosphatase NrnA [Lutispora sp.]MEA4962716.1 bifunctional oligoribonuclease/PAP phosphatase NrnA [Lutispora sp.]HCJ56254.1 bifunctional oligoribonuclease/PAP phosphatase NrnA [Clostridiaceae bacterium]
MINPAVVKLIGDSENIAILSHIMPDGDNIGSSLALYNALSKIGKNVVFILDDDVPEVYKFLKGSQKTEKPDNDHKFDLVIVLDCGDVGRLGRSSRYLEGAKVINIDHHLSNSNFGLYNIVDISAAATGEIIYRLINRLEIALDKDICECIYTGIVTDTGQFQYSNTTDLTHEIAADLVRHGAEPWKLYRAIYQNNSKSKMKLIGEAINSLEFHFQSKIASMIIRKEVFETVGAKDEDADGIINFARDINGVEVALLFKETEDGKVKIGFRSKDFVNVSDIAQEFGGGGHKRAAGATVAGAVENIKERVIESVIKAFSVV